MMEGSGNNNNVHCSNGDVFSTLHACRESCKNNELANSILNDYFARYKLLELYNSEFQLSNSGILSMINYPYSQFNKEHYSLTNTSALVCYPLSSCFSDLTYRSVEHGKYYQFHFNRNLWVNSARQLATFGEYYIWNHTAVVCYPKILENPIQTINAIACLLSATMLFVILSGFCKLESQKLRNTSLYMYITMLFIGYFLQGVYYFYPCPKPILLFASKYNFICSLLWLNLYTIQYLLAAAKQTVHNSISSVSYKHGIFISVLSVIPCWIWIHLTRGSKPLDLMSDDCTFVNVDGVNAETILDGVSTGLVIFNTLTLHMWKFHLSRLGVQLQNSSVKRLYRLTANLCVANSVYMSIKLTRDVIALKEAESLWFYVDILCQWFGFVIFFIFQCDSHLKKLCQKVGQYYDPFRVT